jgi:hypothetical protein
MTSPDTPPGAKVVCIEAGPGRYGHPGLSRGAIFTVERLSPSIDGDHVVVSSRSLLAGEDLLERAAHFRLPRIGDPNASGHRSTSRVLVADARDKTRPRQHDFVLWRAIGVGGPSRRSSSPRSNGSTGSTTRGRRSRSETFPRPNPKRAIMRRLRRWQCGVTRTQWPPANPGRFT